MVTEVPWMWIIGGPNGAGKTTLARAVLGGAIPTNAFVNTDEIAKALKREGWRSDVRAGRFSIEAVEAHLAARTSFAVETTLSSHRYLRLIAGLRREPWRAEVGWKFGLLYVGVANAEISLSRVAKRVSLGGHGVPEVDVRRRFARSISLLRDHAAICDRVVVFDNSSATPHLLVDGWREGLDLRSLTFPWELGDGR
ncbi:MAG: zeta toxin family protein [Magnetospirillum sp.]|nr:zeta toxin family protein [Magnetospirillum sp.]